ncbi:MAG: hypothetical protein RBG1_1C00001G0470 [candidate division Zixibacteria bacterium RBG-1]|nr:MAG: hypothetical protein RBG1_1C00001G0470 [candidate division Zixibacteria bacterium RBG-1]OGC83457.1 MAG: hypothetical protein A2V73_01785 [candidate division Zixibacteria bacterium RBG_19FT_COMBO_42_43]
MADDKKNNEKLLVEVEKLPQSKLKNTSLKVGMVGVAVSTVILVFVCNTYYAQRRFQEASVHPSLILEINKKCQEPKYNCIFTEDESTHTVAYTFTIENKSPYSIKRVRIKSATHPSKQNHVTYASPDSFAQMFTFAPGEKNLNISGKFSPPTADWKSMKHCYLHFRVDFQDPNDRAFVYKKSYFMIFEDYKLSRLQEIFRFLMGVESSSLESLEEEKHNKRENIL